MKRFASIVGLAGCLLPAPAVAQLAAPNAAGVTMGHVHLNVRDIEASKGFWTALGGTPVIIGGTLEAVKFPGVLMILRRAEPARRQSDKRIAGAEVHAVSGPPSFGGRGVGRWELGVGS
jgi:hypothetical protein